MQASHHLTTDLLPLMFFTDIKCGGTNTAVLPGNTNGALCTVGLLVVTLLPVTLPPEAKRELLLVPCHESFSICCTG
jgi:hypothetical protein